jgi:ribosome-associated protein YbcJ (S4-like RNA binding protein)
MTTPTSHKARPTDASAAAGWSGGLFPRDKNPRRMSRAGPWLLPVIIILIGLVQRSAHAASKEYELKAAFLLNFVQFIDWPDSAFADKDAPICIGVLGDDPFGATLDNVLAGETAHNRKLIAKHSKNLDDLKSCQMLFICNSERANVAEVLAKLDNQPVVTVADMDGFIDSGGSINFFLENNKIRFEINPDAASRRGIKISSQLLRLARVRSGS